MSIQRLQSHWGFTRMPFGRDLAPSMLHRHPAHSEAIARISWCVDQCAIGVITGEVGAGKTVAIRAAATALDPARHVLANTGIVALEGSVAAGWNLIHWDGSPVGGLALADPTAEDPTGRGVAAP